MEKYDKHVGIVLGEIGCLFRSNIEDHIKDYELVKKDDVEWLLEPLTEISHPADLVLDAFQICTRWDSVYKLYFHLKDASSIYIPFDKPIKEPIGMRREGNTIIFLDIGEEDIPKPNPFDKSMIIKGDLKPIESKRIPSIWDELVVPFTTIGIWQAVLLDETMALFPKVWHANYLRKTYVFSQADMQQIYDENYKYVLPSDDYLKLLAKYKSTMERDYKTRIDIFKHNKLASYLNRDDIWPTVEIDGDKAIATYHYWNDWGGFCRRIIPVEKHGKSVKIGEFEREVLVEYDCGLRY